MADYNSNMSSVSILIYFMEIQISQSGCSHSYSWGFPSGDFLLAASISNAMGTLFKDSILCVFLHLIFATFFLLFPGRSVTQENRLQGASFSSHFSRQTMKRFIHRKSWEARHRKSFKAQTLKGGSRGGGVVRICSVPH